jgi:heme exporter protein CcmD
VSNFFLMGGYAFYVWSAYITTAIVLAASYILVRKHEQLQLQRLIKAQN